jgi:hypothetical protein
MLNDEQYYQRIDYDRLISLLRYILPIGQKYKIWHADEDPAEALEIMQDQLRAAVDPDRKALLRAELDDLLKKIHRSLEEYHKVLSSR